MSRPRKPAKPPVGRPSLAGGGRTQRFAVALPPDLRTWAERRAAGLGLPLATWVRQLLETERARAAGKKD